MNWIKLKLKGWLGVSALEEQLAAAERQLKTLTTEIDRKVKDLDALTREDWDIGARGPSTIILTGVYRGRGYVKFYEVLPRQFDELVAMFRDREHNHLVRTVDSPPLMDGAFDLRPGKTRERW